MFAVVGNYCINYTIYNRNRIDCITTVYKKDEIVFIHLYAMHLNAMPFFLYILHLCHFFLDFGKVTAWSVYQ